MKVTEEDWAAMERMRGVGKASSKGPVKGDILLSNVQLVDEDVPIIWHGLQRPSDRILRQALTSPEKEPATKAMSDKNNGCHPDDQRKALGAGGVPSTATGVAAVVAPNAAAIYTEDMIVVNGLEDQPIIIAAPPSSQVVEGERVFDDHMDIGDDDDHAKPTKDKSPILKGNPVLAAGFVDSPPKKKRVSRIGRSSVLQVRSFDESANGLLPYLCFPDDGGYNTNGKRSRRRLSSGGEKVSSLADSLMMELGSGGGDKVSPGQVSPPPQSQPPHSHPQPLELGLDPPIPMFAASLDRPSTPGSIQIVSDMDFAAISSKSPSKLPMKLVRTSDVVMGEEVTAHQVMGAAERDPSTAQGGGGFVMAHVEASPAETRSAQLHDDHLVPNHHGHLQTAESSEYTDQLLSQLSGVLPAMSSSQVSSVLSALDSSPPPQTTVPVVKQKKLQVTRSTTGSSDVFIKLEANNNAKRIIVHEDNGRAKRYIKKRLRFSPVECKAGKTRWYKCSGCAFVALEWDAALRHCSRVHPGGTRTFRHRIKCIACSNLFYSLHAIKIHLIADHDVLAQEIHGLLMATLEANKVWRIDTKLKTDRAALSQLQETTKEIKLQDNNSHLVDTLQTTISPLVDNHRPSVKVDRRHNTLSSSSSSKSERHHQNSTGSLFSSLSSKSSGRNHSSSGGRKSSTASTIVRTDVDTQDAGFTLFDSFIDEQSANVAVSAVITNDNATAPENVNSNGMTTTASSDDNEQVVLVSVPEANGSIQQANLSMTNRKQTVKNGRKNEPPQMTAEGEKNSRPPKKPQQESHQQVFLNVDGLPKKLHDIKIEKDNALRCNIFGCSAKFVLSSNMDYHKHCHKGLKWKCPECEMVIGTWHSLSLHLWRQHAIDMELYSCDQCPFKTNSLRKLMNLHKRIHGEERPFLCDICGKGFKTTKQLRNHKSIHRAKEKCAKHEVECSICGRCFTDVRMLRHHTDIVHRKLRPFLCSTCGHAAASRSSLRMHARSHTGEKPYMCSECDYTTGDHNSLRRHKMRHSGAKHYMCPHCPYASIQSSTYKSHLKSKHPGLDEGLMFSCRVCPFRTVKHENYLAHMSTHLTEQKNHQESVSDTQQTAAGVVVIAGATTTAAVSSPLQPQPQHSERSENTEAEESVFDLRTLRLGPDLAADPLLVASDTESVNGELIVPEDIVHR